MPGTKSRDDYLQSDLAAKTPDPDAKPETPLVPPGGVFRWPAPDFLATGVFPPARPRHLAEAAS